MNKFFNLTLVLSVITAFASGCRQRDIRQTEIAVPNVFNKACETRVIEALRPIKGIELDKLIFKNGVLKVRYDSMQLGTKNIEHAIKDAGFDANGFKADPVARGKLPKECLVMATR